MKVKNSNRGQLFLFFFSSCENIRLDVLIMVFFLNIEHLKYNLKHYSNVIQISNRKKYISKLCVLIMIVGVL